MAIATGIEDRDTLKGRVAARAAPWVCGSLVLLFTAGIAGAQPPPSDGAPEASASERELARNEFRAGMRAVEAERWAEALEHFQRAYDIAPRPQILLNIAGALLKGGRVVEAIEAYRRFERTAPPELREQQGEAVERAIAEAQRQMAYVRIEVEGLREGDEVTMDGVVLSRAVLESRLPVDPGEHTVAVVTRDGRELQTAVVPLEPGAEGEVRLERPGPTIPSPREAASGAHADTAGPGSGSPSPAGDGGSGGGGWWRSPWFWVGIGVVVAAAGATAAFMATGGGGREPVSGNFPPGTVRVE